MKFQQRNIEHLEINADKIFDKLWFTYNGGKWEG